MISKNELLRFIRQTYDQQSHDEYKLVLDTMEMFGDESLCDLLGNHVLTADAYDKDATQIKDEMHALAQEAVESMLFRLGVRLYDSVKLQLACAILNGMYRLEFIDDDAMLNETLDSDAEESEILAQLLHQILPLSPEEIEDQIQSVDPNFSNHFKQVIKARQTQETDTDQLSNSDFTKIGAIYSKIRKAANGATLFADNFLQSTETIGLPFTSYSQGLIREFGGEAIQQVEPRTLCLESLAIAAISKEGSSDLYATSMRVAQSLLLNTDRLTMLQEHMNRLIAEVGK